MARAFFVERFTELPTDLSVEMPPDCKSICEDLIYVYIDLKRKRQVIPLETQFNVFKDNCQIFKTVVQEQYEFMAYSIHPGQRSFGVDIMRYFGNLIEVPEEGI
jgi:hypothetical protein